MYLQASIYQCNRQPINVDVSVPVSDAMCLPEDPSMVLQEHGFSNGGADVKDEANHVDNH
jgi:hypothetical protein